MARFLLHSGYSAQGVDTMTELALSSLYDSTREMLLREHQVVLRRMESLERDARDLELDTDGVPCTGFERDQVLTEMLVGRSSEIERALQRIDLGTYGTCAGCSSQIPPRRLEALPFATLCVGCQSAADKRARRRV